MNPLTNTRKITELNAKEVRLGISEDNSWHKAYKDSAWIFVGGLPFELSEGDIICIFSQYGEPVNINLVRDRKSGKSKGFCFICYEDQRSTILAVDNFNGIKICGRTIRVDHVLNYKPPKEGTDDEIAMILADKGCGAEAMHHLEKAVKEPKASGSSSSTWKRESNDPQRSGSGSGVRSRERDDNREGRRQRSPANDSRRERSPRPRR